MINLPLENIPHTTIIIVIENCKISNNYATIKKYAINIHFYSKIKKKKTIKITHYDTSTF